jgi:3-deoxy-D-manno-octulosonic-acid transferase
MYFAYTALLALGLLLSLPYWLLQMARHGKYRAGLKQKLGFVPPYLRKQDAGRVIWVHAVSVGEVLAISSLIARMREAFPQYRVLVSTTTDTGQKLARERFGRENVFYLPLDLPFAIRGLLQCLNPGLVVLAETEFWPNFLRLARQSGARIAVVNARISDRSAPGYRRWRSMLVRILQNVDIFLAQTEEDKNRLIEIGAIAHRVAVSGNLKFDVPAPRESAIAASIREALQQAGARPIVVAGSTVEGEEELLLDAFQKMVANYPQAVMILAPRHPERFSAVARLMEDSGIRYWRRSLWSGNPLAGGIFFLDTVGELAGLYSLADIAFVGGSLVPRGGHNIIEPAKYGAAIVVGNHTENFRDIVSLFEKQNAVRIVAPAEFPSVLLELLANDAERKALGRRGLETLQSQMGATQRTLQALQRLTQEPGESKPGGLQDPS